MDIRYIRHAGGSSGGRAGIFGDFRSRQFLLCAFVLRMVLHNVARFAVTLAVVAGTAFAQDASALSALVGNYTQNVPCKGDGSDPVAVQVKISPKEIVSNVGVCTVLDLKQDGSTTTAHVECHFAAGPLMGDVSFTLKPDHTVDFVDREGNYKSVLHRCPN
jgi:hypothetical protein